jgi:hypothetical protein
VTGRAGVGVGWHGFDDHRDVACVLTGTGIEPPQNNLPGRNRYASALKVLTKRQLDL